MMATGCVNRKVTKSMAIAYKENKEVLIKGGKMNRKRVSLTLISIISCLVLSLAAMPVSVAGAVTSAIQPAVTDFQGASSDNSTIIVGTITDVSTDSVTISDNSTEVTLALDENTTINLRGATAMAAGQTVVAHYSTSTLVASSITVNPARAGGSRNQPPDNQNTDNRSGGNGRFGGDRGNQNPGGNGSGLSDSNSMIRGTITAVDDDSITISDNKTEITLTINSTTKISLKDSESLEEGLSVTVRYNTETLVADSITEGSSGFQGGQKGQVDRGQRNDNSGSSDGSGGPGNEQSAGATMARGTISAISDTSITITSDEDSSTITLTIDSDTRLPCDGIDSLEAGDTVVVFYDSDTLVASSIMAGNNDMSARPEDDQNMGNTDNRTKPGGRFGSDNGGQGVLSMNSSNNNSGSMKSMGGTGNDQQRKRFQGSPR
jgi:hypothetical protein